MEPESFEMYWARFLRAHQQPGTRRMHVAGIAAGMGLVALGVLRGRARTVALGPLVAYGFALASHALVEHNAPALLGRPLWAIVADLKMFALAIDGTLDAEVARVLGRA